MLPPWACPSFLTKGRVYGAAWIRDDIVGSQVSRTSKKKDARCSDLATPTGPKRGYTKSKSGARIPISLRSTPLFPVSTLGRCFRLGIHAAQPASQASRLEQQPASLISSVRGHNTPEKPPLITNQDDEYERGPRHPHNVKHVGGQALGAEVLTGRPDSACLGIAHRTAGALEDKLRGKGRDGEHAVELEGSGPEEDCEREERGVQGDGERV